MNEITQKQLPSATTVGRDIALNDVFSASYATYATILFGMLSVNTGVAILNHNPEPVRDSLVAAYSTIFTQPTFISFKETLDSSEDFDIHEFEEKIASLYAALAERQKPLGREFEAILNTNIRRLYKS